MMKSNIQTIATHAKGYGRQGIKAAMFAAGLMVANMAYAEADYAGTDQKVCGFLDGVNGLLNMGSIAVVTIAVIIAGYQIAFAHKRISDVSPILIGGVLIGAAGQIANMLIGDTGETCTAAVMSITTGNYA